MTADRCKETTTTTGTGDITLLGAVSQFQAFADVFTPPATVSYAIVGQSGTEWEVGVGTLTDATTLERTTVQASSNAGAAVNFSAGTKDVFATITAQDIADILTSLAGKASSVHTHAISDTTGLQTALDGKAASSHTHASGDITGLAASATTDTTNAGNISSGTLADGRFPATVPASTALSVSTGATQFTLAADSARVPGTPVAYFRPTTASSAVVLDLMPSGPSTPTNQLNTGVAWMDIVNRDLTTVADPANWHAARTAIKSDGIVYMGATSGGTSTPQVLRIIGGSFDFREVTSGMASETSRLQILSGGQVIAGTGGWFIIYPTLGLWLTDKQLTLKNTSPLAWYDSAISQTTYMTQLMPESTGVLQQGPDAASPVTQTFKGPDARAGTDTNTVGGRMQIGSGRSTGNATPAVLAFQTTRAGSSGTAAQTLTDTLVLSGTAITASLPVVLQGYTVAQLNALTGLTAGMTAYCTDATAPTYLGTLTGAGAVKCPAFYDGTNWVAH